MAWHSVKKAQGQLTVNIKEGLSMFVGGIVPQQCIFVIVFFTTLDMCSSSC